MRIVKDKTALVVVDLQEKLVPVMADGAGVVSGTVKLIKGFCALGCPVLVTQQYTKGLGESVPPIREALSPFSYIEKTAYSVMGEPDFADALKKTGKKTIVLCGIEAHVCVLQSALDMMEAGYEVFLAADAVSSRGKADKEYAVKRMLCSGVIPTTVESALFELLDNDSKSDIFKTISRLVK